MQNARGSARRASGDENMIQVICGHQFALNQYSYTVRRIDMPQVQ
jgi:hypothetical protein